MQDEPVVEPMAEKEKEVKVEEDIITKKVVRTVEEEVEKIEPQVKEEVEQLEKPVKEDIEKTKLSVKEEVEKAESSAEVKSGGAGAVQVVGMEMTESLEGGQKWSRPPTPVTPRSMTPTIPQPEPQNIYLEGSLPSQSQLLVSQSEIEKLSQGSDESPVILSGKVTLSLIGLDDVRKCAFGFISVVFL